MSFPDCILIDCEQRSDEWFDHRKGYLTASKFGEWLTDYEPKVRLTIDEIKAELDQHGIAYPAKAKKDDYIKLLPNADQFKALLASTVSARSTAASQVLAESAGYPDPPPYVNGDMQRGIDMEPAARDLFQKVTGMTVDQIGFAKSKHGFFGCSPDGLILDRGEGLEIKVPRASKLIQYLDNGVLPDEYSAQVLGSMAVTGAVAWHFFAWHPGFPYFHIRVERDETTEKMLTGLKSYSEYYASLVALMAAKQLEQFTEP